ncbi:hypothetical protein M9H77_17350 [Catharanthus roseus]|uniref:Uncharacterized protein n=1 Tax=Catharanthus roseus TaxID=4058 RepID=A0ACC0B4C4_CATRO|nr:hypothetical protein M9H77_17350 [Catharanthus roseus]
MHRSSTPYGMPTLEENGYRVDPLERGHKTVEGLAQSVLRQTSHHSLRWDGFLVESLEGLEIKLSQDGPGRCSKICSLVLCEWRVRWLRNRVLVRCLASTDHRIPELVSDDLVMGSKLCLWSPPFA